MTERTVAPDRLVDLEELRLLIGPVVDRWYRVGLLRFNSHDDGSDDLLLRDEIARAILPRFSAAEQRVAALEEGLRVYMDHHQPEAYRDSPDCVAVDEQARSLLQSEASLQSSAASQGEAE